MAIPRHSPVRSKDLFLKISSIARMSRRPAASFSSPSPPPTLQCVKPRSPLTPEIAERVGVYVGSGIGAFEVMEREHRKLMTAGPHRVSPFFITATIANLAAGQISIRYGATGPNLTVATACTTGAHAIGEAFRILQRGDADVMILFQCAAGEGRNSGSISNLIECWMFP